MQNGLCTTDMKISQVDSQLDSLKNAVDRYEKLVTRVSDRFISVVRSEPPTAGQRQDLQGAHDSIVPVADKIRNEISRIKIITDNLESIVKRTEN